MTITTGCNCKSYISGVGSYAPERVLTNQDLEAMVDTNDEWIVSRTGMKERRIAAADETTSNMCAQAALRALKMAGVDAAEVDAIIAATITPDVPWPNTGCFVQEQIGAFNAWCVGAEAACSGFVYSVWLADSLIRSGAAKTVLVVAGEKLSTIVDWTDRMTCVLFGDGAGAAVLQAAPKDCSSSIMGGVLGSDGRLKELLIQHAGGSRMPASPETVEQGQHFLKMNGRETFKHAVTQMTQSAFAVLEECGLTTEDVDWYIPHQANMRIILAVGQRLKVPVDKFIVNLEKYGNTSSATIGLALDEAVQDGRIKKGDKILMVAFGGGLTWGSLLLEW